MLDGQSFVNTCTSTRGWFASSYGSEAMGSLSTIQDHSGIHQLPTLEELWSFMGKDLAEVGGHVQTPLKMNESPLEGWGTPKVNRVFIIPVSFWL